MGNVSVTKTCSDENCACNDSAYTTSGLGGAFSSIAGLFGASSFFNPLNTAPLDAAKNQMTQVQNYWTNQIATLQNQVNADQMKEIQEQFKVLQATQDDMNATLSFKISEDRLLIAMLCILTFMLILFDLFLPTKSVTG